MSANRSVDRFSVASVPSNVINYSWPYLFVTGGEHGTSAYRFAGSDPLTELLQPKQTEASATAAAKAKKSNPILDSSTARDCKADASFADAVAGGTFEELGVHVTAHARFDPRNWSFRPRHHRDCTSSDDACDCNDSPAPSDDEADAEAEENARWYDDTHPIRSAEEIRRARLSKQPIRAVSDADDAVDSDYPELTYRPKRRVALRYDFDPVDVARDRFWTAVYALLRSAAAAREFDRYWSLYARVVLYGTRLQPHASTSSSRPQSTAGSLLAVPKPKPVDTVTTAAGVVLRVLPTWSYAAPSNGAPPAAAPPEVVTKLEIEAREFVESERVRVMAGVSFGLTPVDLITLIHLPPSADATDGLAAVLPVHPLQLIVLSYLPKLFSYCSPLCTQPDPCEGCTVGSTGVDAHAPAPSEWRTIAWMQDRTLSIREDERVVKRELDARENAVWGGGSAVIDQAAATWDWGDDSTATAPAAGTASTPAATWDSSYDAAAPAAAPVTPAPPASSTAK